MVVATLGIIMTSPGQTYAVSIFIEHFINDLNISRSLVSTLYAIATVVGSLALPFVGKQIDKRGSRTVMVLATIALGCACIFMGLVRNALMLGVGFVLIRMLGQGALGIVSKNVINLWWVRRRGTVNGIAGLLTAIIGLGGFPILITWLIAFFGWQTAYSILGLMLFLFMLPLTYLFIRNSPESLGLLPDGGLEDSSNTKSAISTPEEHWTRYEAVHTKAFWLMALGLATIAMLSTGLFFHMVSIFQEHDLGAASVALAFLPMAVAMAVVNLASGILADRLPVRFLLATGLLCIAGSLILVQYLQGELTILFYGVLLGSALGLTNTVNSVGWANYFGRHYLGSIVGLSATIMVVGSAIGPLPFGYAKDLLGNYDLTLTLSAIIPVVLAIGNLLVLKPSRQ